MLADQLSNGGFKDVPLEVLSWNYRKTLVVEQIKELKSDIICIEENDKHEELCIEFPEYHSSFYGKEGKKKGQKRDGTSIFYDKSKFEQVEVRNVRECNGILLKLRVKESGKENVLLTLAAVHLKAKLGNEKVRKKQVEKLKSELKKFSLGTFLFICGDFNDVPHSLALNSVKEIPNMQSAYKSYSLFGGDKTGLEGGEPYTTFKERTSVVKICIDYIFFDETAFDLLALLEIPDLQEPLPNKSYPSDHLAISAIFQYK